MTAITSNNVSLSVEAVTSLSTTLRGAADLLDALANSQSLQPVAEQPTVIVQQPVAAAMAKPSIKGRSGDERCSSCKKFLTAEGECRNCTVETEPTSRGMAALFSNPEITVVNTPKASNTPKAKRQSRAARNAVAAQRQEMVAGNGRQTVTVVLTEDGNLAGRQTDGRVAQLIAALGLPVTTQLPYGRLIGRVYAYNKVARQNGHAVLFCQPVDPQGREYSSSDAKYFASLGR